MSIDLNKMPKLGFGLMRLPEKDGVINLDEVCRMVDAYLDAGLTYFDTAYVYHGGNSEKIVKDAGLPDLDDRAKVTNFIEAMGYAGYFSGKEEDRRKLYVTGVNPSKRRRDNVIWAYTIDTVSIGSGKAGKFTIIKGKYNKDPVREGDLIRCEEYHRDGKYFQLDVWRHLAV